MPLIKTLLFSLLLLPLQIFSQDVPGCTDPNANNYNNLANLNDGSCSYSTTFYNPALRFDLPEAISETSALLFFRGGLWTINDSGNDAELFHLDTLNGNIQQTLTISNAINVDWEDLAQDASYIYIGDFGNNEGNRTDLGIYRVRKADIPETGNAQLVADYIAFTYPGYLANSVEMKSNNFDCEAMIAKGDALYLFTKNRGDHKTKLYRLPKVPGNYMAELNDEYPVNGLITAADINEQYDEVVLLGYSDFPFTPFVWLLFDYHENDFFSGNKRRIDMPNVVTTQTEGYTYTTGRNGVISAEKTVVGNQRAFNMNTDQWTDLSPSAFPEFAKADFNFTISPNPVKKGKLTIAFKDLPIGSYQIEVYDSSGKLTGVDTHWAKREKDVIRIKLNVSQLPSGLYFVRVLSNGIMLEKKFIKE